MRQVGDTLVWLGMMIVVTGVVYYTPRFANYVTAAEPDGAPLNVTVQALVTHAQPLASRRSLRAPMEQSR